MITFTRESLPRFIVGTDVANIQIRMKKLRKPTCSYMDPESKYIWYLSIRPREAMYNANAILQYSVKIFIACDKLNERT